MLSKNGKNPMVSTPDMTLAKATIPALLNTSIILLLSKNPIERYMTKFIIAIYIDEYNISFLCCIFFNNITPAIELIIASIVISKLNLTATLIKIQLRMFRAIDTSSLIKIVISIGMQASGITNKEITPSILASNIAIILRILIIINLLVSLNISK